MSRRAYLAAEANRILLLINDLDSDDLAVREKAMADLAALGPTAEAGLRLHLKGQPSSEPPDG